MDNLLPASIRKRTKQPYMAPDSKSFFNGEHLDYLEDLLSEKNLQKTGYFNPKAVSLLIKKCRKNSILGFKDNMAIVGIISTLLAHDMFIENFESRSKEMIKTVMEVKEYAVRV
jgi:asparagine synthase (glutamine-hydrolysing)